MKKKIRIITFLIVISFCLIVANVITEAFSHKPAIKENTVTVEKSELLFSNTLSDYGIKPEWIEKKKLKNAVDSVNYYFSVKIPGELPTAPILSDFNSALFPYKTDLMSSERKIGGITDISILNDGMLKLKAELVPGKDLDRERNSVALIVEYSDELTEENLLKVLKSSVSCTIVVPVDENNLTSLNTITGFSKRYAVLINDEIEGDNFRLENDFSKKRLKETVRTIISTYSNASLFFVDEQSDFFNSGIYNFISGEFLKRKISLHKFGNLVNLTGKDEKDIISLFDFYCNNEEYKKGFPVLISYSDLIKLMPSIIKYKKKGNAFVFASDIIGK